MAGWILSASQQAGLEGNIHTLFILSVRCFMGKCLEAQFIHHSHGWTNPQMSPCICPTSCGKQPMLTAISMCWSRVFRVKMSGMNRFIILNSPLSILNSQLTSLTGWPQFLVSWGENNFTLPMFSHTASFHQSFSCPACGPLFVDLLIPESLLGWSDFPSESLSSFQSLVVNWPWIPSWLLAFLRISSKVKWEVSLHDEHHSPVIFWEKWEPILNPVLFSGAETLRKIPQPISSCHPPPPPKPSLNDTTQGCVEKHFRWNSWHLLWASGGEGEKQARNIF